MRALYLALGVFSILPGKVFLLVLGPHGCSVHQGTELKGCRRQGGHWQQKGLQGHCVLQLPAGEGNFSQ